MAKKKKTAGAPSKMAADAEKHKKKKRKKGKKGEESPPQPAAAQPPQRRRAESGVPPPEAFDNLRRLGPPNLAGPDPQPAQRTLIIAEGGKAKRGKKGKKADAAVARDTPAGAARPPAAEADEPPIGGRGKHSGKTAHFARKRLRRRIMAGAVLLVILAVGAWITVTTLFKIEKFEIQGDCPYTVEEMQAAFGVAPGVAMYGFSMGDAQRRMLEQLPYLESVDIRRKLPTTIQFRVQVAREVYTVPWEGGYLVLSDTLKVLRQAADAPQGLIAIEGLSRLDVAVGKPLALAEGEDQPIPVDDSSSKEQAQSVPQTQVPPSMRDKSSPSGEAGDGSGDASGEGEGTGSSEPEVELPPEVDPAKYYDADESFDALPVLLQALADSGLEDIGWVDVSDPLDLKFHWEDRITVRLGTRSGIEDKMDFVVSLLSSDNPEGVSPQARGTLDMGLYLITKMGYLREE